MKLLRIISIAVWVAIAILVFLYATRTHAMTVGVVSDLHVGKVSKRKSGSSVVYPKQALKYFDKAVSQMKSQGVDLIVSLGDNTNAGGAKYYKKLKKIENKYGIKVLWVKGNHDTKQFKILGPNEYTYEKDGITFTIKDNSSFHKNREFTMEETGGDIILQHIPPLYPDTCDWLPNFSKTDKQIWSGHWHSDTSCDNVRIFPALTEHKKLQYKIVEL